MRVQRSNGWIAAASAAMLALGAGSAAAISAGPFGPGGAGGRINGQTLTIGPGGVVEELDAFLVIAGEDLNGASSGVAAQLSLDALPVGLAYTFSSVVSGDGTDLELVYRFRNDAASAFPAATFVSFVDAEIDEVVNTFFDEYGEVVGSPAAGQGFEIDEPGFHPPRPDLPPAWVPFFGDIFANARNGALDGVDTVPATYPDDVSTALSFQLGPLDPGREIAVRILLSEDGDALGSLALRHFDSDAASATVVTHSGAVVPEPATALLLGVALVAMATGRRIVA